MTAYQLADDKNADREYASFISFSEAGRLPANQFLVVECPGGRRYFATAVGAPLNLGRDALGPTDNTSMNQIEQIGLGKLDRAVAIREAYHHHVRLIRDITDPARMTSVTIRPTTGALARPATDQEIVHCLSLPAIRDETMIGTIINASVPICLSEKVISEHVLIAGTTGSGKTNLLANSLCGSTAMGACAIIWDHKPDYQDIHLPNDEPDLDVEAFGLPDVQYFHIGRAIGINPQEQRISVRSTELDVDMLAATIFYRPGEELQREGAELALETYYEMQQGRDPTIWDFSEWLTKNKDKFKDKINAQTLTAIVNKGSRRNRIPAWVDVNAPATGSGFWQAAQTTLETFNLQKLVAPGRAIVIRIGSDVSDGRSYGLLLSYVLKEIYRLKEAGLIAFPIHNYIDEAQDIFSASRAFREIAEGMLDTNIRKGRSQGIGYFVAVQAADAVPERILNNLNSRIVMRHNSHSQIRIAANMATEEQRAMTNSFGKGEALVYMSGANSIVHAQLRRSPLKLTKHI